MDMIAARAAMDLIAALARLDHAPMVELGPLDDEAAVVGLLGRGEVTYALAGAEACESTFPGIWHIRRRVGDAVLHAVEIADVPSLVAAALADQADGLAAEATAAMGAAAVLAEVAHCLAAGEDRILNLSNLPMGAADLDVLEQRLGTRAVAAEARGHGVCRAAATAVRRVWRVRYFNADDTQLLDTIEIAAAPLAMLAQPEDVADGRDGLRRLVELERGDGHDRVVA